MTTVSALSRKYRGLSKQITTNVKVKNPVTGKIIETFAIWDTGATNSVITEKLASDLGLISFGKALVSGVHGVKQVNRYVVNTTLNNESIQIDSPVTECTSLSPDESIGVLIGMDIITRGDFAITNFNGNTIMSFRVPSIQTIDFVEGLKHSAPVVKEKLPSRNDLCTCGSGKKFKHCHGK